MLSLPQFARPFLKEGESVSVFRSGLGWRGTHLLALRAIACLSLCLVASIPATAEADDRVELSSSTPSDSQLEGLREDYTLAIIDGASPKEIEQLITRRRHVDSVLKTQADEVSFQLEGLQAEKPSTQSNQKTAQLRRRLSLIWLSRIELASLQSQLFAMGSPDAVAAAADASTLIKTALVDFPADSIVRDEVMRLLTEARLQAGDGRAAEAANPTADAPDPAALARSIRIDIANQHFRAAEQKLKEYYLAEKSSGDDSPEMALARLRYLMARQASADSSQSVRQTKAIGDWLDEIEVRLGRSVRRRAETMLSRSRQYRATLNGGKSSTASKESSMQRDQDADPRILRADARYYFRVGQQLPAALAYATAAVKDEKPSRAHESAISSAAILRGLSKQAAAAELLLRIADRQVDPQAASGMLLQAAVLISETDPPPMGRIAEILQTCMDHDAASPPADQARTWLIEIRKAQGKFVDAAMLATQMPSRHWNEQSALRCRETWLEAVVPSFNASSFVASSSEAGQQSGSRQDRLLKMREIFLAASEITDAVLLSRTWNELAILIDDLQPDRLQAAERELDDAFLRQLAAFRIQPAANTTPTSLAYSRDSKEAAAVRWRLNQDIQDHPEFGSELAKYLLQHFAGSDLLTLRWMCLAGPAEKAVQFMRKQQAESDEPAKWISAAATALAEARHNREHHLRVASKLWDELASGLPQDDPVGMAAEVESLRCLFQAGDHQEASAKAELILLTRPPANSELRSVLQSLANPKS